MCLLNFEVYITKQRSVHAYIQLAMLQVHVPTARNRLYFSIVVWLFGESKYSQIQS